MFCRDVRTQRSFEASQRSFEALRRSTKELEEENVAVEEDDYFHPTIYNMFAGDNALEKGPQLELLRRMSVQDYPGDKFVCTVGHLGSTSDKVPLFVQELQSLSKERLEMDE